MITDGAVPASRYTITGVSSRRPTAPRDFAEALPKSHGWLEIESNTNDRLNEANRMQWLGEVAALEESLRHIAKKKIQADRLRAQAGRDEVGVDALG